jgi:rare lipoprotein A
LSAHPRAATLRSRTVRVLGLPKIALLPAALPLLLLAAAGCGHKTATVYAPPPPAIAPAPAANTAAVVPPPRPGASPGANPGESAGTVPGLPAPEGEPFSREEGTASWYKTPYAGRKAADGNVYDENAMTAAHRTLPMGSIVRVTNLANGQQVLVRINDRGPFVDGRIIDLSPAAARAIDMYRAGVSRVRLEAYAPPAGFDLAGKWCVQIGAFLDEADAIQLKNDLKRRYSSAEVTEFGSSTGHWVLIKPRNQDRATADEIAAGIHIPDAEPYLVRLK